MDYTPFVAVTGRLACQAPLHRIASLAAMAAQSNVDHFVASRLLEWLGIWGAVVSAFSTERLTAILTRIRVKWTN